MIYLLVAAVVLVAWWLDRSRRKDIAQLAYRCAMLERMVFRLKQMHRSDQNHSTMVHALSRHQPAGLSEQEAVGYAKEMDRWSNAVADHQALPWLP
jgi:hypothetical protein